MLPHFTGLENAGDAYYFFWLSISAVSSAEKAVQRLVLLVDTVLLVENQYRADSLPLVA